MSFKAWHLANSQSNSFNITIVSKPNISTFVFVEQPGRRSKKVKVTRTLLGETFFFRRHKCKIYYFFCCVIWKPKVTHYVVVLFDLSEWFIDHMGKKEKKIIIIGLLKYILFSLFRYFLSFYVLQRYCRSLIFNFTIHCVIHSVSINTIIFMYFFFRQLVVGETQIMKRYV